MEGRWFRVIYTRALDGYRFLIETWSEPNPGGIQAGPRASGDANPGSAAPRLVVTVRCVACKHEHDVDPHIVVDVEMCPKCFSPCYVVGAVRHA